LINASSHGAFGGEAIPLIPSLWNFAVRALSMLMIASIVAAFRRAFDRTHVRATTDDLTGALTKGAFAERLPRILAARRETGSVLVFAYCDLDGFKQVNDRHGHATGDRVLIAFCRTATGAIRPRDLLARVGGDEFVMLMMTEDAGGAYRAAERVHREIRSKLVSLPTPVTVSMGAVVVEHATASDEQAFLAAADSLMYEVKRAGKDALRVAHVDLAEPERLAA
jgi:diguanylate cyclase (GGDEF)-like protein